MHRSDLLNSFRACCFVVVVFFSRKPHKKRCGRAKYQTTDSNNSRASVCARTETGKCATCGLIRHTRTHTRTHTHSVMTTLPLKKRPTERTKQSTGRELLLASALKRRKQGCVFSAMKSKIREEEICVWLGDSQYVSMCKLR